MGVLFQPGHDPSRVYYGTDTRAQSLLIGAALAMLLLQRGPAAEPACGRLLQVAAIVCAVGIGFLLEPRRRTARFLFRGGFSSRASVAVVIAAAVQPKPGPLGRAAVAAAVARARPDLLRRLPVALAIYIMLTPAGPRTGWTATAVRRARRDYPGGLDRPPTTSSRCRSDAAPSGAAKAPGRWRRRERPASPLSSSSLRAARSFPYRRSRPMRRCLRSKRDAVSQSRGSWSVAIRWASLEPGLTRMRKDKNLSVWNRSHLYCGFSRRLMVDFPVILEDLEERCKNGARPGRRTWRPIRPDLVSFSSEAGTTRTTS